MKKIQIFKIFIINNKLIMKILDKIHIMLNHNPVMRKITRK
jgi:hypothetical protein